MKIVKSAKVLKALSKIYGFKFDKKHKYVTDSGVLETSVTALKNMKTIDYSLKYFDGCFYPFIVSVGK